MTSFSGIDADETFEKVLRDEFDAMKKSYSSQVANLEEEVHKHKTDLLRVKGDLQSEIESLKVKNQAMSSRLIKARNQQSAK